ncbi:MAG TPA: hypothetical protein VFO19_08455, partial [Vicinamibacterales bacterium]|nr:hypothetical protein [Vicinamibacterales bacterium]
MSLPIDQEYGRRLEARRQTLADRERAQIRLSNVRLAIAGSAVLLLIVLGWRAGAPWLVLPFAAFVVAAIIHARLLNDRDRAQSAVAFYERGLARLAHDWIGRGSTGERFREADHPFADDLDLFGRGSAFELLSTSRTRAGEDVLASWLLNPAPPDEIRARQGAVAELAPKIDLRESIAVLGDGLRVGVDAALLRGWATSPHRLGQPAVRLALLALSVVTGTLLAWWWFGPEPPILVVRAAIILAGVEGLVALWYRRQVHHVVHAVDPASRDLELLSTSRTRAGEDVLASWLLNPAPPDEIRA